MNDHNALAQIGAALVIAGAGIAGLIDQTTMLLLTVALIVAPGGRATCRLGRT